MPLTFAHLTSGRATVSPSTTASVTVPNNAAVYVSVAAAQSVVTAVAPTISVSGVGLTWASVADQVYGSRRRLQVFRAVNASGSSASGTISVTATGSGGGELAEMHWSVDRADGVDTVAPNDAATTLAVASGTSLTLPDVGTPATGDRVFAAFAFEGAADSFALDAALTQLGSVIGGSDVRSLKTGYDASDPQGDTPSATWANLSNTAGGIGFIVNAQASGGVSILRQMMQHHGG